VQEKYDFAAPIQFEPRLYGASEAMLLELVRALDEAVKAPLIVGHNPGLEQLIAELTRDDGKGLRRRVAGKFPTGALAIVELSARHWAEVAPGSGEIVELIVPKELA
jgi:phosphohistidine phosphatase